MLTNKVAVLTAPGSIEVMDWPMPPARPGSVAVEVAACGVCGSAVHFFEHGRIGDTAVTESLPTKPFSLFSPALQSRQTGTRQLFTRE